MFGVFGVLLLAGLRCEGLRVPRRALGGLALGGVAGAAVPERAAGVDGFKSYTSAPQFIERGLTFSNGRTMVLTQAFGAARGSAKDDADAGDRTGTYAWPGGVALARYLVSAPGTARGKRVVELGCGTGAAGIMAQWLGAKRVVLTDGSPAVLENTRRNVERNVKRGAEVRRLRWGYAEDIAAAGPAAFDLVLAAEVAYQRETLPAFLATVDVGAPQGCFHVTFQLSSVSAITYVEKKHPSFSRPSKRDEHPESGKPQDSIHSSSRWSENGVLEHE